MDSVENLNIGKIDIDRLDEAMQLGIVKSTSSQLLLTYFVNNSKYKYVHYRALDRIDDEDMLMEIAMKNKSPYWGDYKFRTVSSYLEPTYYNSEKAFSKIYNPSMLIEIVKTIDHELYNLNHLKNFIDDDDFFMQIITGEYDVNFKITALVSIENKENILKVVYNFKDPELSKHAINLIKNESVLRDICEMIPTCESEAEIVRHARKCIYKSFFNSEAKLYTSY